MNSGIRQLLFIFSSVLLGLGFSYFYQGATIATWLINLPLALMLYLLFLTVDFKTIVNAFLDFRFTVTALSINFILTPLIAIFLGQVFFSENFELKLGLLMLLVTPCTDWYLVFTDLAKGNVAKGMSLLPLNLVLQIVLMPFYISLIYDNEILLDTKHLIFNLAIILIIPFCLSVLTKKWLKAENRQGFLFRHNERLSLFCLSIAIFLMFFKEGSALFLNWTLVLAFFLPLGLFFIFAFLLANEFAYKLAFSRDTKIALVFTSMARNSPLSLAIAISVFPLFSLTHLVLVIGPMIELPILAITAYFLGREKLERKK